MFLAFSLGAANNANKAALASHFHADRLYPDRAPGSHRSPAQPHKLRYTQMAVTAKTNVSKKIVASSSILISSKPVRSADPSNDSSTPFQVKIKSLKGDFVVTVTPYATFPCQKFSGINPQNLTSHW